MIRRILGVAVGVVLLALVAWGVITLLERYTRPKPASVATAGAAPAAETAHIVGTVFYVTPEGDLLQPVRREIPLADGLVAQGRQILLTQFEAPPSPYVSAIPKGTTLRAFYLTEKGDAFVDLSGISAHPGGSLAELLTVHAIVNAVTANLPAVQRVQILVDGKEVDTIAGHVDVRRPLPKDTSLVKADVTSQ